jgi:hypothetical protein
MLGGVSFNLTPTSMANAAIGERPYQPWANTMTLVPSLFQELALPALPAYRLTPWGFLLTLQPIGGPQRKHQQSEEDMHPHRPCGFLGGWPRSHCCLVSLMQQFSIRLRSSTSKGCNGCATPALVRNTLLSAHSP